MWAMNGIHPTTRNAIDRAVGAGSAVNASLNGGVLDETALSRYVLALSELRLPHEWAAVRARAFEVLQGSSEKIQTIDNLQAYWRESRNGRRVGSDFEKLARNYISAFTGAMNEALQEQGFSGQFSQPSFSLFEKDGMPGRGGYQAKDQLIYQT